MIPLPSGTKIWLVAGITDTPRQRWERATGSCSCWTGFPRLSGRQ